MWFKAKEQVVAVYVALDTFAALRNLLTLLLGTTHEALFIWHLGQLSKCFLCSSETCLAQGRVQTKVFVLGIQ